VARTAPYMHDGSIATLVERMWSHSRTARRQSQSVAGREHAAPASGAGGKAGAGRLPAGSNGHGPRRTAV